MKYLLMLLCLLVAKPSFAKIVEVDLSYLEGETVTPGYEASVLFNGGEFFNVLLQFTVAVAFMRL